MDTIFKDTFHDADETSRRAGVYAMSFQSLLNDDKNPSQQVIEYCSTIRRACSSHGKKVLKQLDAGSSDFIKIAGILKSMTMWLTTAEAAGKNLALSPDSPMDRMTASNKMGLLQTYHQSLELVLD